MADETVRADIEPGAEVGTNDLADMDSLLAEYDASMAAGSDPETPEHPGPYRNVDIPHEPGGRPDDPRIAELYGWAQERAIRDHHEQSEKDVREATGYAMEKLDDLASRTTENFVRGYLVNEYHVDPAFKRAWENRYQDGEGYLRALGRATKSLRKELETVPDPVATADREAVAAAVRGMSMPHAHEDAPPNFRGKSNHDFREEVFQKYGFMPKV